MRNKNYQNENEKKGRVLTLDIKLTNLGDHSLSVDLTHVKSSIGVSDMSDVKKPLFTTVMCDFELSFTQQNLCVNCQHCRFRIA